jgi:hypothetical protein
MPDLEDRVERAWNPLVRPMVTDAWRCYNGGAVRASIAATWTAVTADLIDKIVRLADEGDGAAQGFSVQIEAARTKGIDPRGVREMQAIEAKLLETAEQLELIDSIGVRELERIREDRHLCVHPSLRPLGEAYELRAEVARAHLAVALDTLLTHPPTQGRKVLDQFKAYVCDPLFSPSPRYVQATFFDRVRSATRRNIVQIAAKHALCEVPVPSEYSVAASTVADRMAACIKAFAERDRGLVRGAMQSLSLRLGGLEGEVQIRALARLGDQDFFWDILDPPFANRLNDLVAVADIGDDLWDPIPSETAAMLALVRDENVRSRLPSLTARFEQLDPWRQAQIAALHPDAYFSRLVAGLLACASDYRSGEMIGQTAVAHGSYYSTDELRQVLAAWWQNDQCRRASKMPGLAVELLAATAHLGADRYGIFREFLNLVWTKEAKDSYYGYQELEAALLTGGH